MSDERSRADSYPARSVSEMVRRRTPTPKPFPVIAADPPWLFGDKLPGKGRGASKKYPCMPAREIMRFPLPPIADNAILFLWRVASMQQEALDVATTWGFAVKSELVWEKLTKNGLPWMGMGRYARASHETALICTRGRYKVRDRGVRSRFAAKAPVDPDTGEYIHSAKPPEFFQIVERMCRGPYMEIFARESRPRWSSIGNEVDARGTAILGAA